MYVVWFELGGSQWRLLSIFCCTGILYWGAGTQAEEVVGGSCLSRLLRLIFLHLSNKCPAFKQTFLHLSNKFPAFKQTFLHLSNKFPAFKE